MDRSKQERTDQVKETYQKGVSDKTPVASLGQSGSVSPNSHNRGKQG